MFQLGKGKITEIHINCGEMINSINMKYGDTWGEKHGGDGGSPCLSAAIKGEMINEVVVNYGKGVNSKFVTIFKLSFKTNKGNYYNGHGTLTQHSDIARAPSEQCYLSHISGTAYTNVLTSIGFTWRCDEGDHISISSICYE